MVYYYYIIVYIIISNIIKDPDIRDHFKCDLIHKMLFWAQFVKVLQHTRHMLNFLEDTGNWDFKYQIRRNCSWPLHGL